MKNGRHLARELVVQGLYEWLIAGNDARAIEHRLSEVRSFEMADRELLDELLNGVIREAPQLEARLAPLLDRVALPKFRRDAASLVESPSPMPHRGCQPARIDS